MKQILVLVTLSCFYTHLFSQQLLPMGEGLKCQGVINSMCVDSSTGNIYAGGYFDVMNEVKANNISFWNGSVWDSLESGVNGPVYNLQFHNGILYCAGSFTINSNSMINNLASWDGLQWNALYTIPPNGSVWQTKIFDGALYASGSFTSIDGVNAKYIAKYKNGVWSSIGNGFNYPPAKMEVVHDSLYFYGYFSTFNGDSVKPPAWIDIAGNTGGYHPYPGELYNVKDIFSMNDSLFGIVNDTVVKWNGLQRIPIFYAPIAIRKAFSHLGNIYVSYDSTYNISFENYHDKIIRKISNGQLDVQVCVSRIIGNGATFDPEYLSFLNYDSSLYIGGTFYSINNKINPGIIGYKNQTISNLGKCGKSYVDPWQNANVQTILKDTISGNIYVGGFFMFAGNKFAPMVAMWDGNQWHPLDSGFTGTVITLAMYNGELYAGGKFKFAGSNQVNGLAKWDGTAWQSVYGGSNKTIYKLFVDGSDLIIGGSFTSIGSNSIQYISRFDGSSFYDMQGSQFWGDIVYDLIYYHNKLYASVASDDLYYRNGNNWVKSWLPLDSRKMVVLDDTLFVGSHSTLFKITDTTTDTLTMTNASYWDYINPIAFQNKLFAVNQDYGIYEKAHNILEPIVEGIYPYCSLDLDSMHTIIAGFFPSITNFSGTKHLNNIGILEYTLPNSTITSNRDSICEFQYVNYYSSSTDLFAKYDWSFPGGLPDSSSRQNPIIQYTSTGNYPVSLIISNLVGSNTYFLPYNINVQNCITSINDQLEEISVHIYPNPFNDEFSIENNSIENINVTIRNLMGSIVDKTSLSGYEKQIVSSDAMTSGLYFVELHGKNFRKVFKLIKQ